MPKAASPIRLEHELMQAAARVGRQQHRSAAEQVEYWAALGRRLVGLLDPESLTAVAAGLAQVRIEPVAGAPIDPERVYAALRSTTRTAQLAADLAAQHPVRYRASAAHPGYLEAVDAEGRVTVGQFKDGQFVAQAVAPR